ncbi:hypothetical protein ADL26_15665 [Thermoactinomyces vulgaris]|nr:hypothetical protein ADL26_15665 [Thermoactinomyces vulgaris]
MSENILRMAEYKEGPTSCTVFYFPEGAQAAIDLQGNVPATITSIACGLLCRWIDLWFGSDLRSGC